jgi:hypothetical protein
MVTGKLQNYLKKWIETGVLRVFGYLKKTS